ncbi:helix-turn-helix domain-containing protein [Terribacillus goriensis]|uniref:TetR/AcrR family transcriptional regulator n=1 Tax=Terribacillus saccharophilus TaxID=361277 RepID=UPI003983AD10
MKKRIIEETIKLIKIRGLSFTISELAQILGTSKRTIYQHYDSKASLVEEIIRQLMQQIKQMEQTVMADEELHTAEKLRRLLAMLPVGYGVLDVRLLSDLKRYYYEQWKVLDQFINEEWDAVRKIISDGVNEGSIRPIQPEVLIDLYIAALNEMSAKNQEQSRQMNMQEKFSELVDILLCGVLSDDGRKVMD